MARRATVVVALAAVVALVPASAALADVTARVISPPPGSTVTQPVAVEVETDFQRLADRRPERVEVRLVAPTGGGVEQLEGSQLVDLRCVQNCSDGDGTTSRWVSERPFDPATFAPFGGDRVCNGSHGIQARVAGGWTSGSGFVVSAPPSAPSDVSVDPGTARATIHWSPAPEPDVVGYTVHRREGSSGSWRTVAEVGPGTTSVTDREAPSGRVEYRVTTFRGDGTDDDGDALSACRDEDRDLHAAAAPVTTTIVAASTEPADGGSSSSPEDGSSTDPDGEDETPSDDDEGGTSEDDDGTDGEDGSTADGDTATPDPAPRRRAPSSSGDGDPRPDVSVPQVEGSSTPDEESFYGEGEEFSDELDFGELGSGQSGDDDVEGSVTLGVPGGLQGAGGEHLVLDRVLKPVAGGMIMLAFALHLRRWVRETID